MKEFLYWLPGKQKDDKMHEEADQFALELLTPEDKVRELWEETHSIGIMAEAFQVSVTAMEKRAKQLNLKRFFNKHH